MSVLLQSHPLPLCWFWAQEFSLENEGRQGHVFWLLGYDVVGENTGENQSTLLLNPLSSMKTKRSSKGDTWVISIAQVSLPQWHHQSKMALPDANSRSLLSEHVTHRQHLLASCKKASCELWDSYFSIKSHWELLSHFLSETLHLCCLLASVST